MEFLLPELGEGVYEAELVQWFVGPGDDVQHGQTLAEVVTDKASMELPSPFAGRVNELVVLPGNEIQVGQSILLYQPEAESGSDGAPHDSVEDDNSENVAVARHDPPLHTEPARRVHDVAAAPPVRRVAQRLGIDLGQVTGSGPEGRVLLDDLTDHISARDPTESSSQPRQPATSGPDSATPGPGARIKLQGVRRSVAAHMTFATQTIPHFSLIEQCNVTELVRLRAALKAPLRERGVTLSYLPFVVKAVVAALRQVAIVNASLEDDTDEIVLHDRYDIGIATETPRGLLVPVLRDAEQRDLINIAVELERLVTAARSAQLAPHELRDGTFTITSIGNLGGLISTPIINHPQVGILGVGRIVRQPAYDDSGNIVPADLMYLSMSFDHRVVDGAPAATFARSVAQQLESPAPLLLPGTSMPFVEKR